MGKRSPAIITVLVIMAFLYPFYTFGGPLTWTQTTDVDFNAGTLRGVAITGTGASGSIILKSKTFSYKRSIAIDNSSGGTLTDYQVKIILDNTNFDFSKVQANGEDIRFVDSDEMTPLNYWIEKWDSVTPKAIVWVKVPSIAASSTKQIYLYYGSATAGDSSDGPMTFEFFDDFEDYQVDSDISGQGGWDAKNLEGAGEAKVRIMNGRNHLRLTSTVHFTTLVNGGISQMTVTYSLGYAREYSDIATEWN